MKQKQEQEQWPLSLKTVAAVFYKANEITASESCKAPA